MESRLLLAAAAAETLFVGAVYTEGDDGSDGQGDTFEITFRGGAPGTELTSIVIDGDKFGDGRSAGDSFFDTDAADPGAYQAFPFTMISLPPGALWKPPSVADGDTRLVLDLKGIQAGEKLKFSIDVDEFQIKMPDGTFTTNAIVEGGEFEFSPFVATFQAPHYDIAEVTARFFDEYDDNFRGSKLDLPSDNHDGQINRTAGAVGDIDQDPLPVTISGTVYLDTNLDLQQDPQDPTEAGIPNVDLALWELGDSGYQPTGDSTTTDNNGDYTFGKNLDLKPGVYQVRETQPQGLFSVGAIPGTVDNQPTGQTVTGDPDVLTEISIPLGDQHAIDLDFAEALPAAISGHVYHDRDNDGNRDAGEEGIGGVPVQVVPIQTIATQAPVSVVTDAGGFYQATGLAPGTYRVVELEQPTSYLDGLDAAGTVGGVTRGNAVNPGDNIEDIFLGGGQTGIEYNFGELVPVSISGHVRLSDPSGDCYSAGIEHRPIEGAVVRLLDSTSTEIAQTVTDANGAYQFDGLWPGTYTVVEVTPVDLIDGADHVGTVGGAAVGALAANDTIAGITLASSQDGINYDFCEHLPASLSGYVYHDRDNDGWKEPGEEGIGSVRVVLIDAAGQEVTNATTNGQGYYEFTGLSAGVYSIVETHPDGWIDGLDRAGTIDGRTVGGAVNPGDRIAAVDLHWGDHGVDYNFGELQYAVIEGSVHLTTPDGDCFTSSTEEQPLAGVTIVLQDENGTTIAQTLTDAQGQYRFDGLLPGSYTVIESTPAGLIDGADHVGTVGGQSVGRVAGNDTLGDIALTSGQAAVDYDFCEHEPACISGFVYHDQNDNGRLDTGEDPIPGAAVRLLDSSGSVVASRQTDGNGFYQFCDLEAGTYSVVETQPVGYLDGTDAAGTVDGVVVGEAVNPGDRIQNVRLRWGDDGIRYDFGELLTGSIAGLVHTELNQDCILDPSEEPIAGVTVELLDENGNVIDTTQTDSNGRYRFDNLPPAVYTVREQQPVGYFHGGQRAGSGGGDDSLDDIISAVAIGSDQHLINYDFCEVPPSSIEGRVYADLNQDCEFDANESPLQGVSVQLLDETGQVIATTHTNAEGRYRFDNLPPGTYTVREQQPAGYFHGGQRAGSHGGDDRLDDIISAIEIDPDQHLVEYNFCEVPPSSIEGRVHVDRNGDCDFNSGDSPLEGVVVELLDDADQVIATTLTDTQGHYHFDNLPPGSYAVREQQPPGYFQGGQSAGTAGGNDSLQDLIFDIPIGPGVQLTDYDFCEVPPSSITGRVHLDLDRDCELDAGEQALSGVTIRLLDEDGNVLSTTRTDDAGSYRFDNLAPSVYVVQEEQPAAYFTSGQQAGSHGGDDSIDNIISAITVSPGQDLVNYDFCEASPGRLSGYVFQDGAPITTLDGQPPENVRDHRDGKKTPDDAPLGGVMLELRDGISGDPITGDQALPGLYGNGPIRTVTDGNGFYEFRGLPRGSYAVYEIHPEGFFDGIDTPGTTSGIAINPSDGVDTLLIQRLSTDPANDAIILIPLASGAVSQDNNFSEIAVDRPPPPPPPPPPIPPEPPVVPPVVPPPPPVFIVPPPPPPKTVATFASGGVIDFTWHLSVIDAGRPRGEPDAASLDLVWRSAVFSNTAAWDPLRLREGQWMMRTGDSTRADWATDQKRAVFGIHGAIPIAGDFDGDGVDEIGIYYKGRWFLDLNGNGIWDEEDLWASLGGELDLPVTGDWNGDGKDDIGIFGPMWMGDPRALEVEHGLPDMHNLTIPVAKPKNVPPTLEEATDGLRYLQHTSEGTMRADVIDHVFHYGDGDHIPITGDWTGDGIKNIGVFHQGSWRLDADGNGRWTDGDIVVKYGQAGDIPVVGDFDGDGIDEIGIYRDGQWIIDINMNRQMDARDRVFEMGSAGDLPVVGDWDGDGVDDPAVYHDTGPQADSEAKAE